MQGNAIAPALKASALGERFRIGSALGSAKASSGKERSSGIARETEPPPKRSDAASTTAASQNTGSFKIPPLAGSVRKRRASGGPISPRFRNQAASRRTSHTRKYLDTRLKKGSSSSWLSSSPGGSDGAAV